ncbi:TetR family transcriptional regulator [Brevundimonas phoenicis]|uniref:TetR family transcriptional regulator n=1 Tax=unclassified Brevundimonas TaxID=2622653 RepID=UPI0039A369FF
MTERLNKRQHAKAVTRKKVIDGAKACWAKPGSYVERTPGGAGIREIAKHIKMSTGAVFANFDSKDDLWRAAFDCEPPIDSIMTRAAPALFEALQDLVDAVSVKLEDQPLYPALAAADLLDRLKEQLLDEQAEREKAQAAASLEATSHAAIELAAA